jgi:hypothetical protein
MEKFNYKAEISVSLEKNENLMDHYKMQMFYRGVEVGFQRLELRRDGSYYFSGLVIYEKFRNQKLGSNFVECMKDFLISKKAVGYLNNTIENENKFNLYESHGWEKVNSNLYMFDGTK